MNDERRFTEDEVAQIIERATRVDGEADRIGSGDDGEPRRPGMTLAEIQRIGREVGISDDAIASSARALVYRSEEPEVNRRWMGVPVGVAGAAELPRRLTEEEWAQLVALIRDRFSAHGKLESAGSLMSWRNGNLRVQLEPNGDGQRIRMQTYRQSATQLMTLGSGMLGAGVVLGALSFAIGDAEAAVSSFGALTLLGTGFITANLLSLRGWAAARRAQMSEIAERAVELASRSLPSGESTSRLGAPRGGDADQGDGES